MRITSGIFRGRKLKSPKGLTTRPTPDRVRAALFNILNHSDWGDLTGKAVLDLFCGTGAFGLEALSNGAEKTVFVDVVTDVCQANITALGVDDHTRIVTGKLPQQIKKLRSGEVFDFVYLDPPYDSSLAFETLTELIVSAHVHADTIYIAEHAKRKTVAWPEELTIFDQRSYGETGLVFLKS